MMASTVAIPQVAIPPNFHGPIPTPMPGSMPGTVPGGYPIQLPVTIHGQVLSGPVVNGNNSPSATLSPPIQTVRLPVVPVGGGCYNDGMEVVWHGEFSRLFSSFFPPHVWYLSITNAAPQEKWKFYRDSAKVRFCCQDCGNGWTSMKGRVTFWFHLNTATSEGFVQFKLYGQVCKKCNSGKFEYVMWYPEEVSKVMCNLYNKVGQTFYGFLQPPIRIDRRPGRPRNQHNADLCQACRDGECDQGRPVKALFNYVPPGVAPRPLNPQVPGRPPMVAAGNQVPVVIRQPPIQQTGPIVVQGTINSSVGQIIQGPPTGPSFITAPVTLTSGVQPILTYSVVTAPRKDVPKLSTVEETVETKPGIACDKIETQSNKSISAYQTEPQPPTTTPIDNIIKKSHAITISTPLVNGTETTKEANVAEFKSSANDHTNSINAATLPKPNGGLPKDAAIVNPSAKKLPAPAAKNSNDEQRTVKDPQPKAAEKATKAPPIMNGYAAAAGKPMQKVHAVNGSV